jgi:hypothetical protein
MNRFSEAREINLTTDYISNTVSKLKIINMETVRKSEAAQ